MDSAANGEHIKKLVSITPINEVPVILTSQENKREKGGVGTEDGQGQHKYPSQHTHQ